MDTQTTSSQKFSVKCFAPRPFCRRNLIEAYTTSPVTIIKITAQTPTFSDQSYGVPYQEAKDAGFLELVRSPANISTFAGLHNNCL